DGLQRIVWTGKTPFAIRTMRLTPRGFRLQFTAPFDPQAATVAANYRLGRFRYVYHEHYGSPRVDSQELRVKEARLAPSRDTVELDIDRLDPGYIYELEVTGVTAADGRALTDATAYYTLNRTLDGRRYEGSITAGSSRPVQVEKPRPPDPKLGQRVYATFCVQCHRADGTGGGLPGIGAADF